ncbi:alpha/beta hydrolase [Gemmiger formicilis]|uniref:alpha/beta hydrolase n=1 Tax=Gemmiger formicilis TaxID=745368 RepID=UPI00195B6365|nr:alpha/beta hydrolase [Gemmiger formicilis]MBM6915997.1 alpha/beta hydrolase [Gemmiger formicilis]
MNAKKKRTAKIWLCIGIVLMLLSVIVASAVQTSGGRVTVKSLSIETDSGYTMTAYLFIPDTATAENPAPGIVTSHGYLNNKEMQDANYVELSRRGFVVLAIDQPCHGNSDNLAINNADGVYQGALALRRMPFVDTNLIGITGHSMGGMSTNAAVASDNSSEEPFISAVLLNNADPTYTDADGNFANIYGSRDVGVVSAQYDEFFHQWTDSEGNRHEAPDYLEWENAQSFLNFGADPANGLEQREADTIYTDTVDGEECIRVIYRPHIIHPWSHFSYQATVGVIDFFSRTLGAPNPIDATNQVWQWKEAFNFVGVIGLALFVINFTILMTTTPAFCDLGVKDPVQPARVADGKGKIWFWGSLTAGALFSMLIYRHILLFGTSLPVSQTETMGLGLWSFLCGLFSILSMIVYYFAYGKKHGMDLAARGVKISVKKLLKTILLAIIVVIVSYGCVFVAEYFCHVDFRLWTLAIKTFGPDKLVQAAMYFWLFMTFYVAASVSANAFNYNEIGGKRSWVNTIIVALFTTLPALILPWIQYIHYFTTDLMLWPESNMHILWLFPIVLILFGTTLISRAVYKATNNPYLAGIVNGCIITLMTVTNTCTTLV